MVVAGFYVIYGFPLTPYMLSKLCEKFDKEVFDKYRNEILKKYPIAEDEDSDDELCRVEDMNDELQNDVKFEDFDCPVVINFAKYLDDKRFSIISGSHYPRWTTYNEEGEIFYGLTQHYSMDPCGKQFPFKEYSEEQKNALETYCQSMFAEELKQDPNFVSLQYHIYPDDCNCCS